MSDIEKPIGLMAFVLVLAIYLHLTWLVILIGIGAFFIILSTVRIHKPRPVAEAKPKEEEVLTPVIVQDVGEAPYLYPPDFRLKVNPNWNANNMFEDASGGLAMAASSLMHIFTGSKLKKR